MIKVSQTIVLAIFIVFLISGCDHQAETGADRSGATEAPLASSRLASLLGAEGSNNFPRVTDARDFLFPDDHGPHANYRNEWWYVTGNLEDDAGNRLGYELTLFRFALAPASDLTDSDSRWRTRQVYVGHFALTDVAAGAFHVAERYSRASLGLAGAEGDPFRVWLEDWEIGAQERDESGAEVFRLRARDQALSIDLTLVAEKPPVLNGDAGLSRKSTEFGNASYYYSMPRLATAGHVVIDGRRSAVVGDSWLDREWGSSALSAEQRGWDWFALQLDDGTELMYYNIRLLDGSPDTMSAGTYVRRDGRVTKLARDAVEITVLGRWESPLGGAYPAHWQLRIPSLSLDIEVRPVLDNQELATIVRYWEGAVDISGTRGGDPISGRGYVELTGYVP